MHDFDIRQGFNEKTVMFCKKCGLSFILTQYGGLGRDSKTVWEAMSFADQQGQDIDPPCKPCQEGYSE